MNLPRFHSEEQTESRRLPGCFLPSRSPPHIALESIPHPIHIKTREQEVNTSQATSSTASSVVR